MDPWTPIGHLPAEDIRRRQNQQLQRFISQYLYPFSPHYQKVFRTQKITPRSIRTIEDLQRIPFCSKQDFIDPHNPQKFREFILQPDVQTIRRFWPLGRQVFLKTLGLLKGQDVLNDRLSKEFRPIFITFTTGTTGKPISTVYTHHDIDNLYLSGSRMLKLFDISCSENIVNMFPFAPHLAFWQVVSGGFAANVLILSTGGGKTMGTDGNIAALLNMKPAVVLGVPSYVYHVLRVAHEKGLQMPFIKKVVLGASRVTLPYKARLAELLVSMGAKDSAIFGTYGFTEARSAWAECPTPQGVSSGYHLYPDKEIFEVIDPKTGEVLKEGQDGELVYTCLDARGSCVIRYRTGDFVKGGISYAPCPHCQRTVPRIASDITRISDIKDMHFSKIKGSLINFNNFTATLSGFPEIEEWQIEIRKKDNDPFEIDELVVYISSRKDIRQDILAETVKQQLLLTTEISPNEVCFLPLHEMIRRLELETANKEKRILDTRPKD
jgi:phenylacetate-coenzyme A ligase PaaK-like adenylate-forming protein